MPSQRRREDAAPDSRREPGTLRQIGSFLGLGAEFAVTIAFCVLGGFWLDQRWTTTPLLTIIGALLGMAAAFYSMYKQVTGEQRDAGDGSRPGDEESCGSD